MAKRECAPVGIDDFEPFYLKRGLIWVPYTDVEANKRMLFLSPATALKGCGFVAGLVGANTNNIIPFVAQALQGDGAHSRG